MVGSPGQGVHAGWNLALLENHGMPLSASATCATPRLDSSIVEDKAYEAGFLKNDVDFGYVYGDTIVTHHLPQQLSRETAVGPRPHIHHTMQNQSAPMLRRWRPRHRLDVVELVVESPHQTVLYLGEQASGLTWEGAHTKSSNMFS